MAVDRSCFPSPLSESADLYGAELTLHLCARLLNDCPNLGLLFFLSRIGDQDRHHRLVAKTSETGLSQHSCFAVGQGFVPALARSSLFLRPTFSDGYGISVTEALHLGVPAIASDMCERPRASVLFRCGGLDDRYTQTKQVLDDYPAAKQNVEEHCPSSALDGLLAVYQKVANKEKG